MKKRSLIVFSLVAFLTLNTFSQKVFTERTYLFVLNSVDGHHGQFSWKMKKAGELNSKCEELSNINYKDTNWLPAIIPGTVLNSLIYNKIYEEPYYGLNNQITDGKIPDLSEVGRDFYTYWFRTEFRLPESLKGKKIWMQVDGINYRAEIWVNEQMVGNIAGMFCQNAFDISDYVSFKDKNGLAIKVIPIDSPGGLKEKGWGATGESHNGGNGEIGRNTTMLMTTGWDFYFMDGIRDRNTGIWKNISIFTTDRLLLSHPFVKSDLEKPNYTLSKETVSVEVSNPNYEEQNCKVVGEISGHGKDKIYFSKNLKLIRNETSEVVFTPTDFPQLVINNPRLWWPVNKGEPYLYNIKLKVLIDNKVVDSISTRFGIREIRTDCNTPDKSKQFYVNGKPIFIRGSNWLPEAMLRSSDERTYAEMRYTQQSGINLLRIWGGGIAESDYWFQLADEMGIMIWQEFWMTGDTKHPIDLPLYLANLASTVKRIRNHPSLAFYVSSNESTEMHGAKELLMKLDGTRNYQMQSECEGVHDGSPYKQVNPMRHYENTASDRGSRVDGFNPEYGAPCLPTVECLREMMEEKDLWPINKRVWDYSDGNCFHLMSTMYTDMVNQYGPSNSIDEFAQKAQFVGAMNYKSIWEVWNYNKLGYGDRYCSGFLFWYHNSPVRQVCGRMWDWSLEPTAALYACQNALQPLHPQFDYLKNTISVVNDYYHSFKNYRVSAEVYDLNSKCYSKKETLVNLPEDGVANDVLKLEFTDSLSTVSFIKLRLFDEREHLVGDAFYWRSNKKYEGLKTLTGPTTSGFQAISHMNKSVVKVKFNYHKIENNSIVTVELNNPSNMLAFSTQIQWLDDAGKPIRPSYYTDNFFSLLPGESKVVTIETNKQNMPANACQLVVKGINQKEQRFVIHVG
jgi:mannosylglycoprotein endo-beta-mannosidase